MLFARVNTNGYRAAGPLGWSWLLPRSLCSQLWRAVRVEVGKRRMHPTPIPAVSPSGSRPENAIDLTGDRSSPVVAALLRRPGMGS